MYVCRYCERGAFIPDKLDIGEFGLRIGKMPKGIYNRISDVPGVTVGHSTLDSEEYKTGVTVVIPGTGDIYNDKLIAAAHVINGFGKTTGIIQIDELGELESPILMTNTLNVGKVQDALVEYMVEKYRDTEIKTFNPVVTECNDSYLNKITDRPVGREHVYEAFEKSEKEFEEGNVGAGTGMSCHGLKGGIGSSSRVFVIGDREYVLGVIVLSNHGIMDDLSINGIRIGSRIKDLTDSESNVDRGSIIVVAATDVPLCSRQLKRLCKRSAVGMARLGSYTGHGSGELVLAFSTANTVSKTKDDFAVMKVLNENKMDVLFRAIAESTEEAILSSMINSKYTVGYGNHHRYSLRDYLYLLNP